MPEAMCRRHRRLDDTVRRWGVDLIGGGHSPAPLASVSVFVYVSLFLGEVNVLPFFPVVSKWTRRSFP